MELISFMKINNVDKHIDNGILIDFCVNLLNY